MNKRLMRVLSLFLVLVMVVSMGTSAFAEGPVVDPNIEIGGDLGGPIAPPDLGEPEDPEPEETEAPEEPEEEPEEAPDMPALNFYEEDEETGLVVTVDAPEGALPEEAELRIARVEVEDIREKVEELFPNEPEIRLALDISFFVGEEEVEPLLPVQVKVTAPELEGRENVTVIHIPDAEEDGEEPAAETVEQIPEEELDFDLGTNEVVFTAQDFSIYAFTSGNHVLTVEFIVYKNGEAQTIINQTLSAQKIANDQVGNNPISDPGVPELNANQSFEGWTMEPDTTKWSGEDIVHYDIVMLNEYIRDKYAAMTQDEKLTVYAMVFDVRYVTYHDQNGAVLKTQSFHIPGDKASVTISMPYVPFGDGQNFIAWTEDITELGADPEYKENPTLYENDKTYEISNSLKLYPYIESGHWLAFDNYIGQDLDATTGTYISPVFYKEDANTVRPEDPTRTGYTFKGWYTSYTTKTATDSNGDKILDDDGKEVKVVDTWGDLFTFGSPITEETTLYARWEPDQTSYQVVFWIQRATDAVDLADSAKHYDYYVPQNTYGTISLTRYAPTGSTAKLNISKSGRTADNRLGGNSTLDSEIGELGYYFTYNENLSDTAGKVVKGDGSTVLNVYYDRRTITINFRVDFSPEKVSYDATASEYTDSEYEGYTFRDCYYNTGYTHYGYVNGEYVQLTLSSSNENYPNEAGWVYCGFEAKTTGEYKFYTSGYATWTVTSTGAAYTGDVYRYYATDSTAKSDIYYTTKGLYKGPCKEWITLGEGSRWYWDGESTYSLSIGWNSYMIYGTNDRSTTDTWNLYFKSFTAESPKNVHWLGQDTDGNYNKELTTGVIGKESNLYFDSTLFLGFTLYGYNTKSNSVSEATKVEKGSFSYNDITGSDAYVYYSRNQWSLAFKSNLADVKTEKVYYEKELSDFADFVPTNGPEGYYFDGWYADPGFNTKFDFSQTMPNNDMAVYAKWTKMRFRVVLDPTGGDTTVNATDITFPGGTQATTFRVDYGEKVQGSSINNAIRSGHTLLGWYLDPEYTIPFNFGNPITDKLERVDMNYATASAAERSGSDPWRGGKTYNDADGDNDDVVGKVTIYARWREDPEGVIGINVVYDAVRGEGHFGSDTSSVIWDDPNIYADLAQAYAQAASTADDAGEQFLYWEILGADGKPTGRKAYPGQTFEVRASDAVVTRKIDAAGQSSGSNGTGALTLNPENLRIIRNGFTVGTMATTTYKWELVTDEVKSDDTVYAFVGEENGKTYALYVDGTKCSYKEVNVSGTSITLTDDGTNISEANAYHWTVDSSSKIVSVSTAKQIVAGDNAYISTGTGGKFTFTFEEGYFDASTTSSKGITRYLRFTTAKSGGFYFLKSTNDPASTIKLYKLVETTEEQPTTKYTVTFKDGLNNSTISTVEVEEGKAATPPTPPTHDGYTFTSWDKDFDNVTSNLTVTAQYTQNAPTTYTVTFNANGGSAVTSQTVESGKTATKPADPTKSGYTFGGWYTDEACTTAYNFSTAVTGNLTLYAKWTEITYTVSFVTAYGTTPEAQTVTAGGKVTTPDTPTADGYTFEGWYTDEACTNVYDFSTQVTDNLTLYAKWTQNDDGTHTVTFVTNGRGTAPAAQQVKDSETASEPEAPTAEGYIFGGWYTDVSCTNAYDFSTPVTGNLTLYAKWTKNADAYTVTLRAVYGRIDTGTTFINFDPNGLTFAPNAETYLESFYSRSAEQVTLSDGAYEVEAMTINEGVKLPGAELFVEKDNSWYTLIGWNTKPDGSGYEIKFSDLTDSSIFGLDNLDRTSSTGGKSNTEANTLYAMWEGRAAFYHSSDNTLEPTDSQIAGVVGTVVYSTYNTDGVTLNIPENMVPDGYLYGGYYTEYNGATNYNAATGAVSGDGTPYSGVNYLWDEKNAGTSRPGDAFVTTKVDIGKTFYIKEVPDGALRPATYYTYYKNTNGDVGDIFFISAIDDLNYEEAGFLVGSDPATATKVPATKVVKKLTISAKTTGESESLTPAGLFGSSGTAGSYWMQDVSANANSKNRLIYAKATDTFTLDQLQKAMIRQYWVTPDGVLVTGQAVRVIDNVFTTSITETTTADTSRIKGVKLTSNTGTTA